MSAADSYWANHTSLGQQVRFETTNSKVADWRPSSEDVLVRGIYGGHLNAEFGGFFSMSEEQIDKAILNRSDHDSHAAVNKAWEEMLKRAWNYDRLLMTAPRFNFFAGPFVASKQNGLLKCTYLTAGKRIALLLDGSKILKNCEIVNEWSDEFSVCRFSMTAVTRLN
jgi:hypothetical protein